MPRPSSAPDLRRLLGDAVRAQDLAALDELVAAAVAECDPAEVVRAAGGLAAEGSAEARAMAAMALARAARGGRAHARAAGERIVAIVASAREPWVLVAALGAMRRAGVALPGALPVLPALAGHPDPGVRWALAGAITCALRGGTLHPEVDRALAALVADADPDVAARARRAVGRPWVVRGPAVCAAVRAAPGRVAGGPAAPRGGARSGRGEG